MSPGSKQWSVSAARQRILCAQLFHKIDSKSARNWKWLFLLPLSALPLFLFHFKLVTIWNCLLTGNTLSTIMPAKFYGNGNTKQLEKIKNCKKLLLCMSAEFSQRFRVLIVSWHWGEKRPCILRLNKQRSAHWIVQATLYVDVFVCVGKHIHSPEHTLILSHTKPIWSRRQGEVVTGRQGDRLNANNWPHSQDWSCRLNKSCKSDKLKNQMSLILKNFF